MSASTLPEPTLPEPTPALISQVELICDSYTRLVGAHLLPPDLRGERLLLAAWETPFVIVSHCAETDPKFNFGNLAALRLWEMETQEFFGLRSRYSAEEEHREERARLLWEVSERGFYSDYRGVRTSKNGRRFRIERAIVFNLSDSTGARRGQAATFRDWTFL